MTKSIMWSRLKSIILVGLLMGCVCPLSAQETFPVHDGDCVYYDFTLVSSRAEISGLCILKLEGDTVNGSIVNDFGATFIDYSFQVRKSKVKLHYVLGQLDKWYIRRILKRNLKEVMKAMRAGETAYRDSRHKLTYTFTVNHDIEK